MFDLITVGDATIDVFTKIHDAEVKCNINKTECKLCIEYGDKIAVDKLDFLVAGNAANNSVGASRLGMKTAIYVNIGDDGSGKKIIQKLKDEKVNTRFVSVHKGMESNYSTVLNFQGERTIFVYHQDWKYKLPDLDQTRWVYFTSISQSFTQTNLISELTHFLERTGSKLVYNPGTYQMKADVTKHPKLLAHTEVFIVNVEEAKRILKHENKENIPVKKLLSDLHQLGPKYIVITDGVDGSFGFDGEKYYQIGIFPAELVEMTGCGDSYATGLMAGLFYGNDLKTAMRWGAANGASVVEHIGPQEGLLTIAKMRDTLNKHKKIVAKEI